MAKIGFIGVGNMGYAMMRGILKNFSKDDILFTDITEEFLGTYTTQKMTIYLGNLGKHIELNPIGACVIAAFGRVDMSGKNGTVRIVLVDSKLDCPHIIATIPDNTDEKQHEISEAKPDLVWRFVKAPPKMSYIPIERETFLEQLMLLS